MFRAARALAQRISTLTVASVVALSSLAATAPMFISATADAHAVSNVTYTFDRTFAWTFDHWNENGIFTHWNGTETQGVATVTTTGVSAFSPSIQPSPSFPFFTIVKNPTQPLLATTASSSWNVAITPGYTLVNKTANLSGLSVTVAPVNSAPSVPALATPANNVVRRSADTNFSTWNASTDPDGDAVTYVYQSSFASDFSSTAFEGSTGSATQIQNGGSNGLEPEGTYYWRVKAVDEHGMASAWSTPRQINIDNTAPVISTNIAEGSVVGGMAVDVQLNTEEANPKIVNIRLLKDGVAVPGQGFYTQSASNNNSWIFNTTALTEGAYTLQFSARDAAGNPGVTIFRSITVDNTAPTLTVKDESARVAGEDDTFTKVSFKLFDANKVDKVVLNGVEKDLDDNEWSDVNDVEPGVFGAVLGENTLQVYDVAGNVATYGFTLVEAPVDEEEEEEEEEETEGEGGQGGGLPTIDPINPAVQQAITQSVLAANSAVIRGSNLTFATTQTPAGNNGQVQAAETNAVDGAVAENENQTKFVEGASNVFKYWWVILLALLAIIGGIAIAQRRSSHKE